MPSRKQKIIDLTLADNASFEPAILARLLNELPRQRLNIAMPDGRYLLQHVAERFDEERIKVLLETEMEVFGINARSSHAKNWQTRALGWALAVEYMNTVRDPFFRPDIFLAFHQLGLPVDKYHWGTYAAPTLQLVQSSFSIERLEFFIELLGVNFKDYCGWTLAHYMGRYGFKHQTRALLAHRPDLSVLTPTGDTPLHLAAMVGDVVVQLYLNAGADPLARNASDKRPLQIAKESQLGHSAGGLTRWNTFHYVADSIKDAVKALRVATKAALRAQQTAAAAAAELAALQAAQAAQLAAAQAAAIVHGVVPVAAIPGQAAAASLDTSAIAPVATAAAQSNALVVYHPQLPPVQTPQTALVLASLQQSAAKQLPLCLLVAGVYLCVLVAQWWNMKTTSEPSLSPSP